MRRGRPSAIKIPPLRRAMTYSKQAHVTVVEAWMAGWLSHKQDVDRERRSLAAAERRGRG